MKINPESAVKIEEILSRSGKGRSERYRSVNLPSTKGPSRGRKDDVCMPANPFACMVPQFIASDGYSELT